MKRPIWPMTIFFALLLLAPFTAQSQDDQAQENDEAPQILDEIEVNEQNRRQGRQPTTGTLQFEPLPVRMAGSPAILTHTNLDLILRPVRLGENDTYVLDDTNGRAFTSVDVELGIGRVIVGSRRALANDGKRAVDLPEAIYAITEVRYTAYNQIGRAFDPDDPFGNPVVQPEREYRFCLAERTIASDIKNGETTDIGRLIIRALERGFPNNKREHRPILGADAEFLSVTHPNFREKAPNKASAGIIQFEDSDPLCRDSAIRSPGWFRPDELAEAFPRFSDRLHASAE